MFCKNCGKDMGDAAFCPACGASASTGATQQPVINVINNNTNTNVNGMGYIHKKKWVAFWLCFFFGVLGIHRFYVGKVGTGIIWFLTGGFFGIGAVIDFFVILFGGFRDKAGQPLI